MARPEENKEVDFHYYCERCINRDTSETADPCNECLDTPVRIGTEKPLKFESIDAYSREIKEKYGRK